MARTPKDLIDWELLLSDRSGTLLPVDQVRSSRRGGDGTVALKRISDGVTITKGDIVKVFNKKQAGESAPNDFSFHMISDIRLFNPSSYIEMWTYKFLQWFEVNPREYYKSTKPDVIEPDKDVQFYENMFANECNKEELYLTVKIVEIKISDILEKITFNEASQGVDGYHVRYLCEHSGQNFVPIEINLELQSVKEQTQKEANAHLTQILWPPKHEKYGLTGKTRTRQGQQSSSSETDKPFSSLNSALASDSSSSDEFREDESDEDGNMLDNQSDEDIDDEDDVRDDDDDAYFSAEEIFQTSNKRGRPKKTITDGQPPKKRGRKAGPNSTYGQIFIKKFTKKNVSRSKKKYTAFSKRFKSVSSIPNLKKMPGFYNQSNEEVFKELESKLDINQTHKVVETIFSKVKKQLYSSHGKEMIIKSKNFGEMLPARENEFASIYLTVYSAIESDSASTVYIGGTPGVGKTLTVREVIKELQNSVNHEELSPFIYVEINGLKIVKPTDSYEVLWNKISGERLTWGASMDSLEFYFQKVPKGKKRTIVVLLDELDALITKGQDIMYNFFNWTTYENAKLIVIAVANTMDLPERQLGNKVSSRIGFTRIMFTGYTHEELRNIIDFRLKGLNDSYFYVDPQTGSASMLQENEAAPAGMKKVQLKMSGDAIEIASRKVASVSGDARRALKVCKRAAEIAEEYYMAKHGYGYDGKAFKNSIDTEDEAEEECEKYKDSDEIQTVHIKHIMKALNETINSNLMMFIQRSSFTMKLFLYSLLNLIKKTGLQEQPLGDVVDEIKLLIEVNGTNKFITNISDALFGRDITSKSEQLRMVSWNCVINQLIDAGILIKQNTKNERISCVKINMSIEDIKHAVYQDEVFKVL
ncbi:origin recognition complex subunit 1 KNAG_0E04000 [Huiozyma naganishii CBS 8797]|uniref:Origin recognition complex subunit 1 n=1 Tax=Huiozyma naganishii (strain ATCC MYA-139 / BCRC 22969 / CBS 8797 / KCTC 17520 / NBRC 10181 / NCYC 3082 / Yp74L-3) TaxID=1071383 RepID=J7RM84_HUIN7|nr:hypothetical protein KNAG_0E04000 [Kazachstania naganishii CBS 8797]CCK70653.1 hypothetical protein KNAG_0E04000 [Kazachstania naganishii CBS 8797]